jgi:hypothetical protein
MDGCRGCRVDDMDGCMYVYAIAYGRTKAVIMWTSLLTDVIAVNYCLLYTTCMTVFFKFGILIVKSVAK